ncbi:MAG: hypothetical protein DRQ55_05140 [Planctomycetota bacterium]|nr:MAG: hypothetical protein DRQ55_05140 [Planctomycetota bacterium]
MHTATPVARTPARARMTWALVSTLALISAPLLSAQAEVCEPNAGPIVVEVESTNATGSWVQENSIAGYTGDGYFRWAGSNHYNQPGNGVLTYIINVTTPGIYNCRIRNMHVNPDGTLENDCFTRMDGSPWEKSFSSIPQEWNWATWIAPASSSQYKSFYALTAGQHVFQISARSAQFRVDRIHFFITGTPGGQAEAWSESNCPSQWTDVGNGLAGTGGITPLLEGAGDLSAGSSNEANLTGALPGSTTHLLVGFSLLNTSFKGGVLVPSPDVLFLGLPVDGAGALSLPFVWPAGVPAGTPIWLQHWVSDPAGPKNLAASNGLMGEAS